MFVFGSSPPRNLAAGAIRKEYNHTFETALTLCIDQKILVTISASTLTLLGSLTSKKQPELPACIDLLSINKFNRDVIKFRFWQRAAVAALTN